MNQLTTLPRIILGEEVTGMMIFPTLRCNLDCSFCLNEFDPNFTRVVPGELTGEQWVRGLNRIESKLNVPVTFSGGEPFVHRDFVYIVKNLKQDLKIDILTNLMWKKKGIERFISEISPEKISRDVPYPQIRASYHPGESDPDELIANAKMLQNAGFKVGIFSVLYPSPQQNTEIVKMQYRCANEGLLFRVKEFVGMYEGTLYGDYSKYPGASFSKERKDVACKTPELHVGPNGAVYRCHRDLYAKQFPIGHILDRDFQFDPKFTFCPNYGDCHPCDVKVKIDTYQRELRTIADIRFDDESVKNAPNIEYDPKAQRAISNLRE